MNPNDPNADPLHEYEEHAMPSDEDRARRLAELKRAIRAGTYDERQLLDRLLNHIDDGIMERDVPAEDDSQS